MATVVAASLKSANEIGPQSPDTGGSEEVYVVHVIDPTNS